ncbi:hypothetical protein KFK09_003869 [Dendrobium nobile]|uniref:Uncharacterized protein n=1 Tax=Dendrobium nobile TaxID=94219 RepID=A0A8T3C4P2_DENNO|nr:hypothetical protein KFK09_003869 [Dendrobium nobile]
MIRTSPGSMLSSPHLPATFSIHLHHLHQMIWIPRSFSLYFLLIISNSENLAPDFLGGRMVLKVMALTTVKCSLVPENMEEGLFTHNNHEEGELVQDDMDEGALTHAKELGNLDMSNWTTLILKLLLEHSHTKPHESIWYLDSGYSKYMTGDTTQYISAEARYGGNITLRDNTTRKVIGTDYYSKPNWLCQGNRYF